MTVQTISTEMPVGRIVLDHPQVRPLFEKLRIDYPCSGGQSLRQAAQAAGIDPDSVILQLEDILQTAPAPVFGDISLADLCCQLVNVHHAGLKQELPNLKCLLCKLRQSCPKLYASMLKRLSEILDGLTETLDVHMLKEEQELFPQIAQLEAFAAGRAERLEVKPAEIDMAVGQLTRVHSMTAESLSAIRDLTEDFSWLDRSSSSFQFLYWGLSAVIDGLHEHIHYENNLLFPRVLTLANSLNMD